MNHHVFVGTASPLSGFLLVLRQRLRRTAKRDMLGMVILLMSLLATSFLLEVQPPERRHLQVVTGVADNAFWVGTPLYLNSVGEFASRWLLMHLFLMSLVILPIAALLGARTVPGLPEVAATSEALLTRLNAYEISLARLIASLAPLLGALGVSPIIWAFIWAFRGRTGHLGTSFVAAGGGAIIASHLVLLTAVFMVGAMGALFASRSEPGSWWIRGGVAGLVLCLFSLGGIVLLDGTLPRFENPVPWINALLLMNPIAAISGALKVDVLRSVWLYQHTQAHDYPFAYPDILVACGFYTALGSGSILMTGWRLRHAYREKSILTRTPDRSAQSRELPPG